jgi:hypothetical protein
MALTRHRAEVEGNVGLGVAGSNSAPACMRMPFEGLVVAQIMGRCGGRRWSHAASCQRAPDHVTGTGEALQLRRPRRDPQAMCPGAGVRVSAR